MSKRYSGKSFKDSSIMKKAKLSLKEKRRLKKGKKKKQMCGRYVVKKSTLINANSLVKKNINVDLDQDNFNCSPGTKLPIIKLATNGKYLEQNMWGLKASWAKEEYKRLHNARLEGIDKKITFKKLIVNTRAVVPASGYFEWAKGESGKIPFYFTTGD